MINLPDKIKFECSGRVFYCFSNRIGLSTELDDDDITYGHDGQLDDCREGDDFDFEGMTAAEKAELAQHMIERWKAVLEKNKPAEGK